jgi:hypothetical protein
MDVFLRTGFASEAWLDHFTRTEQQAIDYAWSKIDACEEEKCPLSTQENCPACTMKPGN